MHILITNDDGPPSPHSSPYVHCLVHHLQQAGHTVSVCLPHTQRSWIGKAHMIGQTVKPLYYRPAKTLHGEEAMGTVHHRPSPDPAVEEWILVDGTPASCVQIGLHHFFERRGPVDLVVSGPNYGRNTTAVFALSSGTLGAALEAAVCKWRAVALSFAFFSRNHDPVIIEGACRHAVRVVEALWRQWPGDGSVDLYSVNVPLVEGVERNKTLWTKMLQNYWSLGSCFQEVEGSVGDEGEEEERIREGKGGESEVNGEAVKGAGEGNGTGTGGHQHKHFKWAPKFGDVYRSVEEAGPGSDGWAVKEGQTSITPLKANFWHGATELHGKELEFPDTEVMTSDLSKLNITEKDPIYALIHYEDTYVQPILIAALHKLYPSIKLLPPPPPPPKPNHTDEPLDLASLLPSASSRILAILQYEAIDFSFAAAHPSTCLINSYMIRKALIRKHFLSATVDAWVAKRPGSVLGGHVKRSEGFEVDFAEFLEDGLVECWDLRASLERNGGMGNEGGEGREWWILKPGMSERGQGIRLFSTMGEFQEIFDGWEADLPPSDDEGEDEDGDGEHKDGREVTAQGNEGDFINTSHLRHFIAQPYIHPPLLITSRKFHIRTYVLALGRLQIYVYNHMLALFAPKPYQPPWESSSPEAHLTNTCLQNPPAAGSSSSSPSSSVQAFDDLPLEESLRADVKGQIREVVGEVFEAAARSMMVFFQPLGNGFEVFGVDFLVDEGGRAWLLEVNSFPDFGQTGGRLKGVVEGFWEAVLRRSVGGFFCGGGVEEEGDDGLVLVREVGLSGP